MSRGRLLPTRVLLFGVLLFLLVQVASWRVFADRQLAESLPRLIQECEAGVGATSSRQTGFVVVLMDEEVRKLGTATSQLKAYLESEGDTVLMESEARSASLLDASGCDGCIIFDHGFLRSTPAVATAEIWSVRFKLWWVSGYWLFRECDLAWGG